MANDSNPRAVGSWDGPAPRAALYDFWTVYDRHLDTINLRTMEFVEKHPVLGPMVRAIPPAVREEQSRQSREKLRAAMEGGWAAYEKDLVTQGATYAKAGMDFRVWYELMGAFTPVVVPLLMEAYGTEPARCAAAISALMAFVDWCMAGIGDAYLQTKQALVEEQRAIAEKRADELRISEERYRSFVQGNIAVVWIRDPHGRFTGTEDAWEAYTGQSRAAYEGHGWVDALHPDDRPAAHARLATLGNQEAVDFEARLWNAAAKEYRWCQGRAVPIKNADGSMREWFGTYTDIHDKKQNDEITRRSKDLEEENRRIQEANRLKSVFLASMSHELRTPLNAIIGFAELLYDGAVPPGSPQHHEFLGDILAGGRHLLQLINDVLDLAKVEAGKMEFHAEPASLRKLAGEVTTILRSIAAQKSIRIAVDVQDEVDRVVLDPGRFKQVLYNYLSNALKFTPDAGHVTVRARPEGAHAFRLEVQDDGVGISLEDQRRLFTEFQQAGGRAGDPDLPRGTGLGLALTRRLVEAQGGTVGLRSTPGEGSVFHAVLPRQAQRSAPLPEPRFFRGARPGAPVVLVVEDDAREQALLVRTLGDAGYAVETAATAAQALSLCRQRAYDAVTLDLLLPDTSGLEVLRAIRRGELNPNVPVIIVSVVSERGSVAGFAVHDYLQKPLDGGALLASLERAGLSPGGPAAVLVVDDDAGSLRLMESVLARVGFTAICRPDGISALAVARSERPAAVVLDLMMPGMDGFQFLEELRSAPETRRTPVIVWTVKDLTAEELARLRLSAQSVVTKGGGAAALLEELRALLPAPASAPAEA